MRLLKNNIFLITLWMFTQTCYAIETIPVAEFSRQNLNGWETHEFKDSTQYSLTELDGRTALKATSNASASGLVRKMSIDLYQTPIINWEWKVENSLYRLAEDLKEGDDFVARVYVIVDGGILFWRTLALNYVWASRKPVNDLWDNPFTSNAKMIAIESGDENAGKWMTEKRNVRQDLQKAFGRDFRFIDAIAIMTDTDNSGQRALAYYGDIYFSAE